MKAALVTEGKFIARPNWALWNKGTKHVSPPLTFKDKVGLATSRRLMSCFSLDNFTVNWVRCHGVETLGERFFKPFTDPSKQTQCPPKWDGPAPV